ncbi:hypothetical protein K3495_g2767 [Podosphaera aphanis]|nr:hypothetical protein K3495_g2767 [Podosphaera aphanis]
MADQSRGTTQTTLTTTILSSSTTISPVKSTIQILITGSVNPSTVNMNTASQIQQAESMVNGVVIGLLSSFGSALLIALVALIVYFFKYTPSGHIFLDRIGRPGEYDDEQSSAREEAEALEEMDDLQRAEYLRAKAFIHANPPESLPTDISLSQYLAIQEKGVSAWEFEPELEIANCFVEGRTEIEFFDSECSTMTNLPIPKQNEVYYWESKIYDKPESTLISIGVATKPYPLFRLPGWHKYSVAYLSNGQRRFNQPFRGPLYGPQFVQGDVVGVGYRPRTGTIFFTRNGKRLEDVAHGLKSQNLFPVVGANGPCSVHVNFGQSGFVFIEANVKKWGLAPMTGSLAPPPPYGSEQGSILLETGRESARSSQGLVSDGRDGRIWTANLRHGPPNSPGPVRSPTDISLAHLTYMNFNDEARDMNDTTQQHQHADDNNMRQSDNDHTQQPPPEYTNRHAQEQVRNECERTPLMKQKLSPPIPSYTDAVAESADLESQPLPFSENFQDSERDSDNRFMES